MDVTQAKQEHLLALKGTSFSTPCIKLLPSPGAYRDFHLSALERKSPSLVEKRYPTKTGSVFLLYGKDRNNALPPTF